MTETRREAHREYMRDWRRTEAGRSCERRTYAAKKLKAWYAPSKRRAVKKYRSTEKGSENHRRLARQWSSQNSSKVRASKSAYHAAHREVITDKVRAWQLANADKVASYKTTSKARRKGAEGKHTGAEIRALMQSQGGLCAICAIDISSKFHRDHKTPLSRGGSNYIDNIQLLCPRCNLRKHAKTTEEFLHT